MRDRRDKSWFWVDNALVDRTDLNLYEKMIYICLARHSGGNDYAFPKLSTLCRELGVKDTRTVVKYIKALEQKGLIEIEKRKGTTNYYYLNNVELPTSDVPSLEKVPTTDVPTFDVPSNTECGGSTYIECRGGTYNRCTPKNTNIKNTNLNNNTTTKTNINNNSVSIDNSGSSLVLDKKNINNIKSALLSHGLGIETCKNIMELVYAKKVDLPRIKQVLVVAQMKQWRDGAIYQALRDNWNLETPESATPEVVPTPEELSAKISWLKKFAGIWGDKELRAEFEKLVLPIPLELLEKNRSKMGRMTIFEMKNCLINLKKGA